jgi:hypothetical protein
MPSCSPPGIATLRVASATPRSGSNWLALGTPREASHDTVGLSDRDDRWTLRSVSKLARMLGLVQGGWYLEVPGVKAERRRDTRGPAVEDIRRMLAATAGDTETATRDAAIVVVLFALGLQA